MTEEARNIAIAQTTEELKYKENDLTQASVLLEAALANKDAYTKVSNGIIELSDGLADILDTILGRQAAEVESLQRAKKQLEDSIAQRKDRLRKLKANSPGPGPNPGPGSATGAMGRPTPKTA